MILYYLIVIHRPFPPYLTWLLLTFFIGINIITDFAMFLSLSFFFFHSFSFISFIHFFIFSLHITCAHTVDKQLLTSLYRSPIKRSNIITNIPKLINFQCEGSHRFYYYQNKYTVCVCLRFYMEDVVNPLTMGGRNLAKLHKTAKIPMNLDYNIWLLLFSNSLGCKEGVADGPMERKRDNLFKIIIIITEYLILQ